MSKSVLITGTSQGIGHALTKLLLINGYSVIGTSTTGIDNINENNYKSCSLDLSNLDSIAAFEKKLHIENIKVDILINNAGIGSDLDFELPQEISFKKTFEYLDSIQAPVIIVETGCVRNSDPWALTGEGHSTILFDKYVQARADGSMVYSVDILSLIHISEPTRH